MTATRWGILSTAKINGLVLAGAALSDEVEVVAVASRDQEHADAYAREHGIPRGHGSYQALLADPDVDAVYISLPNGLHCEWSINALEAGKHVLCEKPMSRRPEQLKAVFDTAESNDRFCMEAFMWRHNPQARKLKELVDEGAIGELRLVRAAFSFPLTDLGNVRMRPELEGGALMDVGCYCISGTRLLAGEPERVTGQQVVGSTGVDVRFAATLSFPDDVLGHFHCGMDLPDNSELEAIGSDGSIRASDPWHCRRPGLSLQRGEVVEEVAIDLENSYRLELENLGRAIRGEGDPLLGRRDALGQAGTIEALYRSAESGEAVELA
jgi:D-xylose 1-dehydrogenase (NADP+, D-xylono-1,5-lactone-forming)